MAASDLKPVYLIVSDQDLLVEQALTRLKKRVSEVADLDFNSDSFDAENADADSIVSAANTLPFASDLRLVIVKRVDKLSKEGAETLVTYCANPSPTTVVAMTAEKLAKNTRLYKAADALGGVLERHAPKAGDLPRAVQSMFADRGRKIPLDAAELLVSSVGKDLRRLSVEIDKAIAFAGERTELTRGDVEEVVSTTAPTSIFEFTDALAARDCRRTLSLTADLIGDGESVFALHAMAVRTVRELIAMRSLLDRGAGTPELVTALGKPEWLLRKLRRQAENFAPEELSHMLRAAAAGEAEMKTSRDARLVLERWIVKVCG